MAQSLPHYINGAWLEGSGPSMQSINPATGEVSSSFRTLNPTELNHAVGAAYFAFDVWVDLGVEKRIGILNRYAAELKARKTDLAQTISQETGKPLWESLGEVDAMINKVPLSIEAHTMRRSEESRPTPDAQAITRFKPHGVAAVLGPFNMPGHLPNGHIVPALLAGNTIVFKSSEYTPRIANKMAECFEAGGLLKGVMSVIHGARETGSALATHRDIDAIFFTGSAAAGIAINKANAHRPGLILALEMGGNNPLVIWDVADLKAAALLTIQSAFITSGQRCSCARRLIIPQDGQPFLNQLIELTRQIRVGPHTDRPEPFMGPVISDAAAQTLLKAQANLINLGGKPLLEMRSTGPRPAFLTPGIIDVTDVVDLPDEEHFGPLLQVIRVASSDAAIAEANKTRYGLCAGLLSDDRGRFDQFYRQVRAGVIHWNRPTTGASSMLPFGGIGESGNHRPAGYWSADYSSYPVALLESDKLRLPATMPPGIELK
ncbi:MAG TPA: succinylglutamate-semialdehyde dehydrogenase [Tepidisphaeraceae bacterium]|jgi:succinylglutamic semialdehyde dehydrogenase|nr:succinylglutamate-semialdehyde dehydrogenase [Tepidisphaeraceae bacterium]